MSPSVDMYHIQLASLSLAPVLAELHAESFGVEGWSLKQIEGSLEIAASRAWIAFENGSPAGFILCQILPTEAEVLTLCVRPSCRRRKIGETLLRHAIEDARQTDCGKIWLEVAADNVAARALYERFGFEVTGTRRRYYKRGATTIDAILLGYSIPA